MGNNENSYAEILGFTACLREKDKTTWVFFLRQHKIKKFKSHSSHVHVPSSYDLLLLYFALILQWFNQLSWNNGQQNKNYGIAFDWVSKLNSYAAWAEEWQRWSKVGSYSTGSEKKRKKSSEERWKLRQGTPIHHPSIKHMILKNHV